MKILIISSDLPPAGGAEKVAWDLAKSLAKSNKVFIITFGKENSFKRIDNVDVYFFKNVNHNLWYYMTLGRGHILKIVNKINPDVINSHMHNIITFVLRFNKAKKILTLHNSKYEFYNKSKAQKLKHTLITHKSLKKYKITTVSKHMQKYFLSYLNKNVTHIPNGINLEQFYFKSEIKKEIKKILYVGRLVEFKGVKSIFEASKKLKNYKFQFIGSGPLMNYYESDNIEFLGKKNSSELIDFYNQSFISIFPSKYENFPLVGLEAMACGSIVLANDILGFREYIKNGENGFLADITSSDIIFEKITEIANLENLELIKQNAFKTVEQLDISKVTEMYLKKYKE
jgi:glycosyltransferase involved in cell wall biosynthesis